MIIPALALLLCASSPLDEEPAFRAALELYEQGRFGEAERSLEPLLDGAQAPEDRVRLLSTWAMLAEARGDIHGARDRLRRALSVGEVTLPERAPPSLGRRLEEARLPPDDPPTAKATTSTTPPDAASEAADGNVEAAPAAPPMAEAAAPTTAAASEPPAASPAEAPASPAEAKPTAAASTSGAPAADDATPAAPPVEEEGTTIELGGTLWAVAGGLATFGLLVGGGALLFSASAGLRYLDSNDPSLDDERRAAALDSVPGNLQIAGVLALGSVALFTVAGGSAAAAWIFEE